LGRQGDGENHENTQHPVIVYLTFNDPPSGIYSSQVIDVVNFIGSVTGKKVRLFAFVSLRGFSQNRSEIKKQLSAAIVLPMVPGLKRWRWNTVALRFLLAWYKPEVVIARSVFAARLTQLSWSGRVVYDGRGAIAAEWKEYSVVKNREILDDAESMERDSVLKSSFRIAVSQHLVDDWRREYGYSGHDHVVIPCTINNVFESIRLDESAIEVARKHFGFSASDIVLVYSGSVAGWQSMSLLYSFLRKQLKVSPLCKVLFLSPGSPDIDALAQEFPRQIVRRACAPDQVPGLLLAGDYGLLLREQSVTNKVASPVKFAEYLSCGLPIIISENLGDYSEFVRTFRCGSGPDNICLVKVSTQEKRRIRELGLAHFTKSAFESQYQLLASLK
jgi:hypothetical protein